MKICLRCGQEFKRTSHLIRHTDRKNKCQIKYLNIPCTTMLANYDKYFQDFVSIIGINNISHMYNLDIINGSQISNSDLLEISQFSCEFCSKEFKHKSNYYRHKNHYCKNAKEKKKIDEIMQEFMETKYDVLKIEYEQKNNQLKAEFEQKVMEYCQCNEFR